MSLMQTPRGACSLDPRFPLSFCSSGNAFVDSVITSAIMSGSPDIASIFFFLLARRPNILSNARDSSV